MNILTSLIDSLLVFITRHKTSPFLPPLMNITHDHWLEGAIRQPIPGGAEMNIRRFLVIHFTGGWGALNTIDDHWRTPAPRGSNAHLIIDRDGTIYQCRPFNRTAGHAGESRWRDPGTSKMYSGLNACGIGIELANSGDLVRDNFPKNAGPALEGKLIPRFATRHKNGGPIARWEEYPLAQLQACERVSRALVTRYKLDDLVGHDDIAPDRKNDPGPAFPMEALRQACGFHGMPVPG